MATCPSPTPQILQVPAHPDMVPVPAHPDMVPVPAHPEMVPVPAHPDMAAVPTSSATTKRKYVKKLSVPGAVNKKKDSEASSSATKRKRVKKKPEGKKVVPKEGKQKDPVSEAVENRAGEFIVEAIRAKKEDKGTTYFFIKWQGYPEYDNTWEPIAHLSGCRVLVEAFLREHESDEKKKGKTSRKRETQSAKCNGSKSTSRTKRPKSDSVPRHGKALFEGEPDEETSDDDFEYNEAVALEKTRSFIEFDIATRLPRDRSPKRIVHVTVLDGKLAYLVQWKNQLDSIDEIEEVNSENSSMVDGSIFRYRYPQMIIEFYESRLQRKDPIEDELLGARACNIMVSAKERNLNPEIDNDSSDDDEMLFNEDKISSPKLDRFGLPMNLVSSDDSSGESSSSDSDSDFC